MLQVLSPSSNGHKKRQRLTFTPMKLPADLFGGEYQDMEFFYNDIAVRTYDDNYGDFFVPYAEQMDTLMAEQETLNAEGDVLQAREVYAIANPEAEDANPVSVEEAQDWNQRMNDWSSRFFDVRKSLACERAAHLIDHVKMPGRIAGPHPNNPASYLKLEDEDAMAEHRLPVLELLVNPLFVAEVAKKSRDPFMWRAEYITSSS